MSTNEELPFIGRNELINDLMNMVIHYNNDDLVDNNADFEAVNNVFKMYGISGIGKSRIIEELIKKVSENEELEYIPIIKINCDIPNINESIFLDILIEKMEGIFGKDIFAKYKKYKLNFYNRYDIAENIADISMESVVPDTIQTFGTILGAPIIGTVLKYGVQSVSRMFITANERKSEDKLVSLHDEFINEINNVISGNKLILCIDALEKVSDNSKGDLRLEWLFGEEGLIKRIPQILWIISGQDYFENSMEIKGIDDLELDTFLEEILIDNENKDNLKNKIITLSNGIPYIFEYFVSRLDDEEFIHLFSSENPSFVSKNIYQRCFNRYSLQHLKILGILASLNYWNDEIIEYVVEELRCHDILRWNIEYDWENIYKFILYLPIVRKNNEERTFYNDVKQYYEELISEKDKLIIFQYAANYYQDLYSLKEYNFDKDNTIKVLKMNYEWVNSIDSMNFNKEEKNPIIIILVKNIFNYISEIACKDNVEEWYDVCFSILGLEEESIKDLYNLKVLELMLNYSIKMFYKTAAIKIYDEQIRISQNLGNMVLYWNKMINRYNYSFGTEDFNKYEIYTNVLEKAVDFYLSLESSLEKVELMNKIFTDLVRMEFFTQKEKENTKGKRIWNCLINEFQKNVLDAGLNDDKKYSLELEMIENVNLCLYYNCYKINDFPKLDIILNDIKTSENTVFIDNGRYYFQMARYTYKLETYEQAAKYFELSLKYGMDNVHWIMWAYRACADVYIADDKLEQALEKIQYILAEGNSHETNSWTKAYYQFMYILCSIWKEDKKNEPILKLIKDFELNLLNHTGGNLIDERISNLLYVIYYLSRHEEYNDAYVWMKYAEKEANEGYARSGRKNINYYRNMMRLSCVKGYLYDKIYDLDDETYKTIITCINEFWAYMHTVKAIKKDIETDLLDQIKIIKSLELKLKGHFVIK